MEMEKIYNHKNVEEKIYKMWEEGRYFAPKIDKSKKPYTILLPLPNANDSLHMGHALFTIEDILARYHRMMGDPTLWLPGADHAGIETQYVFEKKLAKEEKSRFDFDRNTLYQMISQYVEQNKNTNKDQLKKMGFSLDWPRYHYSLEPKILETVFSTFRKLHADNLIYRGERMVNYCTKCGTAFSDLEIDHKEQTDTLYYLDYGSLQIATARPETIFADVAIAVNPKDKRYKELIGKTAVIPLINKEIPIIADPEIKIKFGTGALKVTPAHDETDYQIGLKHKLPVISTLDLNGRMINTPDKYIGMKVTQARQAVLGDLNIAGKLVVEEPLTHTISVCYRCNTTIEPMIMPQWFVKIKPLAEKAIKAVRSGETKIVPKKRFEKMYFDWMENILDWNISRQIVWGPRIPIWYCLDCNPKISINFLDKNNKRVSGIYKDIKEKYTFEEIEKGLQSLTAPVDATYHLTSGVCSKCKGSNVLQETDTFDTWFLSGQWPLTALGFPDSEDFKYFYPTSLLDTLWDILFFWVARMMMLGIYQTGKAPFEVVHLHCRVVDKFGQKMSKSKNNVINPLEVIEKYGADALRMATIFGAAPGSDISISDDKVRSMRNFANKVWNIGRFLLLMIEGYGKEIPFSPDKMAKDLKPQDKKIIKELKALVASVDNHLSKYRFDKACEEIYQFMWHDLADVYVEDVKNRNDKEIALCVLRHVYLTCLKLLHPFMPFITEEIWGKMPRKYNEPLIISSWPKAVKE